jgi:hypothetical protein
MIECPNCGCEISSEFFDCDSNQIWWCDNCGSIALGYDNNEPDADDWVVPEIG